jgi:hypothetical protein
LPRELVVCDFLSAYLLVEELNIRRETYWTSVDGNIDGNIDVRAKSLDFE